MSSRSPLITALLVILTGTAMLGTYAVIDSFDLVRQAMEKNQKSMNDIQRELGRMQQLLQKGRFVDASTNSTSTNDASKGSTNSTQPSAPTEVSAMSSGPNRPFNNSDIIDPDAQDGGIRRMRMDGFPTSWNYVTSNEATVSAIWDLCNDSLAGRSSSNPKVFEPRLAESWTISKDGLIFTIRLREGIMWQNFIDPCTQTAYHDVPVTAHDFVFAIETIRNPKIPQAAPLANYFKDMKSIVANDDRTLTVTWREPYFLAMEITLGLIPLPRHLYRPDPKTTDDDFAEDLLNRKTARDQLIVGCGAYRFANYEKDKRLVLERYDRYVGPRPSIPRIEYQVIKDENKALQELKSGSLDEMGLSATMWTEQTPQPEFYTVCDDVTKAEVLTEAYNTKKREAYLAGKDIGPHTFEKYLYRSFSFSFIAWNMRHALFADRDVRLALTHAIDRERIIREVFHNLGVQTTGYFVPHSLYYDKSITPWPFDLNKATRLLEGAGWSDTDGDGILDKDLDNDGTRDPFRFTFLMFANHPYQSKWVPLIQQDLLKIGVDMKVKTLEPSVYFKMIEERNFDACSFYWSGGIESDPFQLWHGSEADKRASSNIPGFKNAEADRIIETARRTLDLDKRIALYNQFHQILHEEQPYTFIHCPNALYAVNKRFVNIRVFPTGMPRIVMWVPSALQIRE